MKLDKGKMHQVVTAAAERQPNQRALWKTAKYNYAEDDTIPPENEKGVWALKEHWQNGTGPFRDDGA